MPTLKVKNNGVWETVAGGSSGGSNTQIQTDYNQNDASALDYIKNRPCYVEYNKVVFDQSFTTQLEDDLFNMYYADSPIYDVNTEKPGKTIFVTAGNDIYSCNEKLIYEELPVFGNKIIFLESYANATGHTIEQIITALPEYEVFNDDSGEPFLLMILDGILMIMTRHAGTFNYKIQVDMFHMLDNNFIPDIEALPAVTTNNNGQTLTVVGGEWAVTAPPSGLPAVSTADNDKILIVVDGKWVAGSIANGDEVYY